MSFDYYEMLRRDLHDAKTGQLRYELLKSFLEAYEAKEKLKQSDPHNKCRLCAKYTEDMDKSARICRTCLSKYLTQMVDKVIGTSRKTHFCKKCLSHYDACICPEKLSMQKLKK